MFSGLKDDLKNLGKKATEKLDDVKDSVNSIKDAEYVLNKDQLESMLAGADVAIDGPRGKIVLKVTELIG